MRFAEWLRLREAADAAARSRDLVAALLGRYPVIHDLGTGTGSMGRWLAPQLPGQAASMVFSRQFTTAV